MPTTRPASKLPALENPEADPRVAEMFSAIRSRGAKIMNVHRTLAHAPSVFKPWGTLAASLRYNISLSRELCLLVILRTSQVAECEYEEVIHHSMAQHAGINAVKVDALVRWRSSDAFTELERAALEYTEQVTRDGVIDETTMARISGMLNPQQLVELTASIAYYTGTARLLKSLGVTVGDDETALNPG
jgi:alkylhydroperoxidase family enzyme